jgi:valyl-tRNA synthetase
MFAGHGEGSISRESWPAAEQELVDETAEAGIQIIFEIIKGIRSLRSDMSLPPKKKAKVYLHTESSSLNGLLAGEADMLKNLSVLSDLIIAEGREQIPRMAVSTVVSRCQIFLPIEELEDIEKLVERMEHELERVKKEVDSTEKKLSNESFLKNAPVEIIQAEKEREQAGKNHFEKIRKHLDVLKKVIVSDVEAR